MILPPSPALSCCDSLDGIEDLDAYLDKQGGLSHFPTPPLANKPTPILQAVETEDGLIADDDDDDLNCMCAPVHGLAFPADTRQMTILH